MQPSDTVAGEALIGWALLTLQEGECFRIKQLAAAAADPAAPIAVMHQPEERKKPRPSTAPLVHSVGVMGGIVEQARIERADAITLVVERSRLAVGARRDEVAILGIEEKHEPEENGQQSFIEMFGPARCQSFDPRAISGMETTKQLVKRAQYLRGEPRRDLRLRFAARFEERRQTAVGRVIV